MGKTWLDLKNETLQKMFSYSNGGDVASTGNEDYLLAMPALANYALRDLASVCRPIYGKYSISHNPVANILGDTGDQFAVVQSAGEDIIYAVDDPKAFYFEADGLCTVLLEQVIDEVALVIQSYSNTVQGQFSAHSGVIELTGTIQLRFLAGTTYNIRNVAFYASSFAAAADVPPFTRFDRYNLKTLIGSTFMKLAPNSVVITGQGRHRKSDEFQWEPDCTFVVDHYAAVQYDIFYQAYPTEITATTDDTFEPELQPEALDIVPLYMASQLLLDDESMKPVGTHYLNQYSTRRSELGDDTPAIGAEEWNSESGWW